MQTLQQARDSKPAFPLFDGDKISIIVRKQCGINQTDFQVRYWSEEQIAGGSEITPQGELIEFVEVL